MINRNDKGLKRLLGKYVLVKCVNYFYAGRLSGVDKYNILLEEALVVYDTGKIAEPGFYSTGKLPNKWYVRTAAIESYGEYDVAS